MNPQAQHDGPKVTIAIPTVDRAGYLRLAVESALAQSYSNLEVIVSNNACTDGTAAYLASCADPRLRVLTQAHRLSMVDNWNACVRAASGKFFLLLSDDDLLETDAIRELVAGYEPRPGERAPGMVYCGGSFINSEGKVTVLFRHSPLREDARELIRNFVRGRRDLWFCAVLLRTEDLLPGFPTEFRVACDAAVWMRAVLRGGAAVFIPRQLVRYRQHQSLSCTTPLEIWRQDQKQLHRWISEEDRRAGSPDPSFARGLDRAMHEAELRTIVAWINHSLGEDRPRALVAYARVLPTFLSPSGMYFFTRGLFALFLNEESRLWLRRRFRKQPAVAQELV